MKRFRRHFGRVVSCLLSFVLLTGPVLGHAPMVAAGSPRTAPSLEAPGGDLVESERSVESSPSVVEEDLSRRSENSKHFLLSDGTYRAEVSEAAIHFADDHGQWQDIDTSLYLERL